ncbi:MAG: HAMP domain-containing histidine kinase [Krumholzibacteria bacterium]|nr:HAMP domain-containing histidine kinase [Candidatus Krumholzibacteria bacterium]
MPRPQLPSVTAGPAFGAGLRRGSSVSPWRSAAIFAGGYLVVCLPYIWFSGRLAAALAPDVGSLETIERFKGQIFVLLSGLLLFAVSYFYLRRIRDQEEAILDRERSLARAEHVAMAGVLAASTCHDTNNMLMAVRGNLELLADEPGLGTEARELADRALTNCDRAAAALKRLMDLSRGSLPGRAERHALAPLIQEILALGSRHEAVRPHLLGSDVPPDLVATINAQLLTGALLNLLLNAGEAMAEPGEIRVVAKALAGAVAVEVHDAGPGVPAGLEQQILTPFFTTKPRGTGLGLLSVRACALEHGGMLEVGPSPLLGGALFRLVLPQRPPGPAD